NGYYQPEYKSIIAYDFSANSWSLDMSELSSERHWMAAVNYKNSHYVIGGFEDVGEAVNTVEEIIPLGPTGVDYEPAVTVGYLLEQNYPNPFNPLTKIRWHSSEGNWHTLKVYDVLGNEVATLADEYKPAGTYEIIFSVGQDSSPDISSGIYFYQLRAGNYTETKKMVLMR